MKDKETQKQHLKDIMRADETAGVYDVPKKQIKDYLHLYLGCDGLFSIYGREYSCKLTGVTSEKFSIHSSGNRASTDYYNEVHLKNFKPILRPLSSMTEEEMRVLVPLAITDGSTILANAEMTRYLLSKHIDLFGLIEAGLAIDATKQNEPA